MPAATKRTRIPQPQDPLLPSYADPLAGGLGTPITGRSREQPFDQDFGGEFSWESPLTDVQSPNQPAPTTPQAGPAPDVGDDPRRNNPGMADPMSDLTNALEALKTATDPGKRSMIRDHLARTIFTALKTGGHDVSWEGEDILIVDGRRYEVAGAASSADASGWDTDGYAQPGFTASNFGNAPSGYDPAKWSNPNHQTPKYVVSRILATHDLKTADGRAAAIADIQRAYPGTTWGGRDVVNIPGIGEVDIIGDFGDDPRSQNTLAWQPVGAGGPASAAAPGPRGVTSGTALESGGASGQAGLAGGIAAPAAPTRFAPSYQPGPISFDDIPDFSFDEQLERAGSYAPGDLGGLAPTDLDRASEAAAMRLLEHPYSLNDLDVDKLKARSKDELAEMQRMDEDDLLTASYAQGWGDSPFHKSEINAGRASRDRALISSNRDIDEFAAETRKGDERSAAQLASQIGGQSHAQRLSSASLRESTRQAAASSRQQAVSQATNATLQRAALTGDRMALRESVNQEAARIGIAADELQQRWTIAMLQDATQRYGIDADVDVALAQLSQRGREFAEELAFKFAQLAQNDAQFGADFGLNFEKFRHDVDQDYIDNVFRATED